MDRPGNHGGSALAGSRPSTRIPRLRHGHAPIALPLAGGGFRRPPRLNMDKASVALAPKVSPGGASGSQAREAQLACYLPTRPSNKATSCWKAVSANDKPGSPRSQSFLWNSPPADLLPDAAPLRPLREGDRHRRPLCLGVQPRSATRSPGSATRHASAPSIAGGHIALRPGSRPARADSYAGLLMKMVRCDVIAQQYEKAASREGPARDSAARGRGSATTTSSRATTPRGRQRSYQREFDESERQQAGRVQCFWTSAVAFARC